MNWNAETMRSLSPSSSSTRFAAATSFVRPRKDHATAQRNVAPRIPMAVSMP
jgi:hypothetical protein